MANRNKQISIIDLYDSESPEVTEFRRVIRNINRSPNGNGKKAILITSAMLSEGKSLITSFLAMTAAFSLGKKTLLIDFDLRRPMIHKLFGLSVQKGIVEILTNAVSSRNLIKKTSHENLDILTAGVIVHNPSDIFNGAAIHRVIEEMKFYYDLILVDSPPLIPVLDPIVLLEEMDGAIMVVKAGATGKDIIERARDLLNNQKDKVIGVVVNNLNQSLPYYYNHNYYGYHYKSTEKK
ncbi:MAG: CpsD/CapB family tyrosine-protein kinase [Candidatus Zixiibacteriota bacterium]